jgi:hypothetical protein
VTVYVWVEVNVAVTVAPVVALSPVDGDQEYVEAPEAVRLTLPANAIEGDAGVTPTVGSALFVSTTSSEEVHVPLVIVQRKVTLLPAEMPETVDVAEEELVIVAEPLTILHVPVPVDGAFPANVKEPLLQFA